MNLSGQGLSNRAPDFLLGGAARGGTTTLYSYLSRTPGIFMSREKEPHFFLVWNEQLFYKDDRQRFATDYTSHSPEDYLRFFGPAQPADILGEASSWYLYGGEKTIVNIRRFYGPKARGVKIVFILRNPVDRAWSHYWLKRTRGEEHLSFAEAIRPEVARDRLARRCSVAFDYLGQSFYSRNVEAFLESFDAVKVLFFEDLGRDPAGTLTGLYTFLGLPPVAPPPGIHRMNASGIPRNKAAGALSRLTFRPNALKSLVKQVIPRRLRYNLKNRVGARLLRQPVLDDSLRRELAGVFRKDIIRLERLINRDLGAWLKESAGPSPRPTG